MGTDEGIDDGASDAAINVGEGGVEAACVMFERFVARGKDDTCLVGIAVDVGPMVGP